MAGLARATCGRAYTHVRRSAADRRIPALIPVPEAFAFRESTLTHAADWARRPRARSSRRPCPAELASARYSFVTRLGVQFRGDAAAWRLGWPRITQRGDFAAARAYHYFKKHTKEGCPMSGDGPVAKSITTALRSWAHRRRERARPTVLGRPPDVPVSPCRQRQLTGRTRCQDARDPDNTRHPSADRANIPVRHQSDIR